MTTKEFNRLVYFMDTWVGVADYRFSIELYEAQAKHLSYPMVYPPQSKWQKQQHERPIDFWNFIMGDFILGYHYKHVKSINAWASFYNKEVKYF